MTDNTHKPVILLAFANDRVEGVRYLRNLPDEARRLRKHLEQAQQQGLCELVLRQNSTLDEILDVFQGESYRHRIAIFHYGGHANGYQLQFETAQGHPAVAHAGGLAAFLGQQAQEGELKLVFLNGCSTEPQVQALLDAGVPSVIATSQAIDDAVATAFATRFYQGLARGTALHSAFVQAEAAVKAERGDTPRQLYAAGTQAAAADRWPWMLYVRPGAETVAQWDLPSAAGDPLFGLPPLPKLDLPATPYRYLNWYRREDAELFFGRGRTIRDLYTRITSADAPPVLLFYGQSGVGKTSLLTAGLLPRLALSHTAVYLRRRRMRGLLGTLTAPPSPLSTDTPGLGWVSAEAQVEKPLFVILDQVEEAFTRPKKEPPDEMAQFLAAVQGVFGDPTQRPQGKLLLSFRKEWLAEIERQLPKYAPPRAKVFLDPLDHAGIVEVVTGPARVERLQQHYGLSVEEGLADEIADDLLADPDSPVATTLQILLAKLWEQASKRSPSQPHFDWALYHEVRRGGIALDSFLDQQLQKLRRVHATAVESGLVLDLLAFHTTAKGTAEQRSREELERAYPHHPDLPKLVQRSKNLYLLSDAGGEGSTDGVTRLAHDTLAPLVRTRFESSSAPGQRARRILESRVPRQDEGAQPPSINESLKPLGEIDLDLVEAGKMGMRALTETEQHLVEISRKKRRRNRLIFTAIVGLSLGVFVALIWIWIGRLAEKSDLAVSEAHRYAQQAIQLLDQDAVASLQTSLVTLPEPGGATERAYVPEAEFALNQAVRLSLERKYLRVSDPPLAVEHVAFSSRQIAVGANGLYLAPYDLSETGIVTLTDHVPAIKGLSWNDEADAVSVWYSRTMQVWLPSGQTFEPQSLEDEPIRCVHWRPHAKQIAICQDTSLWLWSYEEAEPQRLLSDIAEDVTIRDMAWSEDGHQFAAVGDTTVWFGSVGTPGDIRPIGLDISAEAVEFLDGERLVIWNYRRGNHAQLRATSGERTHAFSTSWGVLRDVALSPDKKKLLTLLVGGVIRVWDVETGELLRELHGHTNTVLSVAWHPQYPDRPFIASFAADGTARVWNLDTGEQLVTLRGQTPAQGDSRYDLAGQWHHDEQHMFTVGEDGTIRLWRVFDDQGYPLCEGVVRCYGFSRRFSPSDTPTEIARAQWADRNTVLVADDFGNAWRWKISDSDASGGWERAVPEQAHQRAIVAWAPRGDWLFTCHRNQSTPEACNGDGTLRELNTGRTITISAPISYATWLDMGLLVSQEFGNLRIFNLDSGSSVASATLVGHKGSIHAAQAHGDRLATGGQDGEIMIWDHKTATPRVTLSLREGKLGYQRPITRLQWSPDGQYLLSSHGGDIVTLWDVEEQSPLDTWGNARAAAFSPDGRLVAVGMHRSFFIFDTQTSLLAGERLAHENLIQGVAWVEARTWPNQDWGGPVAGGLLRTLQRKPWRTPVTRLLLLTWGDDRTLRIWASVDTWATEIARLSSTGEIWTAAVNEDGSRLLTVDATRVLRVWEIWLNSPEQLRETARTLVTR